MLQILKSLLKVPRLPEVKIPQRIVICELCSSSYGVLIVIGFSTEIIENYEEIMPVITKGDNHKVRRHHNLAANSVIFKVMFIC